TDGMTIYMAKCKTAPKAKKEWTVTVDVATFANNDKVTINGVTYKKLTDADDAGALKLKGEHKTGELYPKQLQAKVVELLKEAAKTNNVKLEDTAGNYVFFKAANSDPYSQVVAGSTKIDLTNPAFNDKETIYLAKRES
ncbi:MAG: hypothetical protein ACTTI3_03845, partial [Treponema sp.]